MALTRIIATPIARTRALPTWAKYLATGGTVAAVLPLSLALAAVLPPGYPFLPFFFAVLVAGSLFDRGAGFLATALSAALASWFFLPPAGSLRVHDPHSALGLLLFVAVGASIATVIEVLHSALLRERRARADLARSERQRRLLLNEFRHRTRNDLQSLAALLLLRPRAAPSPASTPGSPTATCRAGTGATTPPGWTPGTSSKASAATSTTRCPAGSCGPSPWSPKRSRTRSTPSARCTLASC